MLNHQLNRPSRLTFRHLINGGVQIAPTDRQQRIGIGVETDGRQDRLAQRHGPDCSPPAG
ncbi:hypothetical protein [Marinobacterium aestuariivivens]|uniref:Uncharacterized protein n=1 Tax=Marinobacterium aestuariivivens TaxID=1698799 RepID=A0ABW1ZV94_9GAMM